VSASWEAKFPLAKFNMLPKGVSDHNPLAISFEDRISGNEYIFRFEKWWLKKDDFEVLARETWGIECPLKDLVDMWQFKMRALRKRIKGWS
jgi:hypothetical protein